jgi:hypothetical protein
VRLWDGRGPETAVTFIGVDAPPDLPEGSETYTVERLHELIPA